MLTDAQYATLQTAILADPVLNAYPNSSDGNKDMCDQQLNVELLPAFVIWREVVPLNEVGLAMDGQELSSLTAANTSRLQVRAAYFSTSGENPSSATTRTFYDQVFSTGGVTKANLAVLWKRNALYGEKILATGTGTNADPALMSYRGAILPDDVAKARSG